MRVLFTSTGGIGHVQPVLPLAVAMRDRGHDVVVAAPPPALLRAKAAGLPTQAAGAPAPEQMAEFRRRWPEAASLRGAALGDFMFPRLFGAVGAPKTFDDVMPFATEWRPDLVVSEQAELAGPLVARAIGVPQATHAFGLPVPAQRVQGAADECRALWQQAGFEPRPFGGSYDHLYIDIFPPSLQEGDLSRLGRTQRSRPYSLTRVAGDELPAPVADAIGERRPIVYVTFGTVFNVNAQFAAVVAAAAGLPDFFTVVTVGPNGDVAALAPQPEHVHIARYIPQVDLLEHCAAVVSHSGSGTLLGALANGVPQVCVPQAADQFGNAAACARSGAGVALIGDAATVDGVESAIRQVVDDDAFRDNAEAIAKEIAVMPDLHEVAQTLEDLAP
jgi:UDP:flavonoid glycosyltransferase YjiC (YdhE family)